MLSIKQTYYSRVAAAVSLLLFLSQAVLAAGSGANGAQRRNIIIIVCDGLRAGSVKEKSAPALYSLEMRGVRFTNSHSLFPTFTTANASAIATGHYLGDTGDFSNVIDIGYPLYNTGNFGKTPGTHTPFVENDQVLTDLDDHYQGNYLTEESLLAFARDQGYNTAAIGKIGPVLIQDVTQGNIDHGTGVVPAPKTVIIDDATGKPSGIPLDSTIAAALSSSGLGTSAPDRGDNAKSGNNVTPGTLVPNTVQQTYFVNAITRVVLPSFAAGGKPFAMVFWSRDPDGTQHNQGDSLNKLAPGINGPTSAAAIHNLDNNLAQILAYLRANHLNSNTDVFVTADHGFSTISRHEIDAAGDAVQSYAAGFTYFDASGRQEVNTGFAPTGVLAIDLAHELSLPLYDSDSQIRGSDGKMMYEPVDPAAGRPSDTVKQHPSAGNGLIGGIGAVQSPTDAKVIVAENGGSDLIYLPTGTFAERSARVRRILDILTRQNYVSGIFADEQYGTVPGALPLSAINLIGSTRLPRPALAVNFCSFTTDPAQPYQHGVSFADTSLQEGQGVHGSFSRADTFNFMAAIGPDFKTGYIDRLPVSNADVPVTLAYAAGFQIPAVGRLKGRIIAESLRKSNLPVPRKARSETMTSNAAANGRRTILRYQQVGAVQYFDAAGFPGRTLGL